MRGRGCRAHVCLYFTVFAALYVKPCSENRVKYGVRCEGAKRRSRGTLCFTVFAALYVKPCSENPVKYGARGTVTVSSVTVACVLRCLRYLILSHVQKTL